MLLVKEGLGSVHEPGKLGSPLIFVVEKEDLELVRTDKSVKVIVTTVVMDHCVVPDWLLFFLLVLSSFILGFSDLLCCLFSFFDCLSHLGQLIGVRGRSLDKLGDEGESGDLRQLAFEQH